MEIQRMRTWAEIDLDALEYNYQALRRRLEPGCRFLGMCKANAYGHGAVEVARRLEALGCEMLAVACLQEAVELRQSGISAPILCLGPTGEEYAPLLLEYEITQTVCDSAGAQALSRIAAQRGKALKVHIKVDTGMTRLGFLWREGREEELTEEIFQITRLPGLECEGLFTHFADSSCNEGYTMTQFSRFLDLRERLAVRGAAFQICHCANSGAVLHYPCTHLDMVRPGIALYGYYPEEGDRELTAVPLRPVMKLKSRITQVRMVPAGTPVSYGCTQVLERQCRVAVLPIGYGDDYSRLFSRQTAVLLNGRRCPVLGAVCMDMCMIDVTDAGPVAAGDVAVVYGEGGLLEQAAALIGTIPYELLCQVSARVPRLCPERE